MKKILKVLFLSVTGVLLTLVITTTLVLWAMDRLNKKGFQEALDFVQNNPPATIWETVMMDLGFYGDAEADPSYGRQLVPARGHAPWVMRSNLDERPQVLNFDLVLGEPLAEGLEPVPGDLQVRQWFYHPTEQYGGPKIDPTDLPVTGLELSSDRLSLHAQIPGLKAGYVVYLALDRRLQSQSGETLWAYEAWYTLNAIPIGAGDK